MEQGASVTAATQAADPAVAESSREHADAPPVDDMVPAPPLNDHVTDAPAVYDAGDSLVDDDHADDDVAATAPAVDDAANTPFVGDVADVPPVGDMTNASTVNHAHDTPMENAINAPPFDNTSHVLAGGGVANATTVGDVANDPIVDDDVANSLPADGPADANPVGDAANTRPVHEEANPSVDDAENSSAVYDVASAPVDANVKGVVAPAIYGGGTAALDASRAMGTSNGDTTPPPTNEDALAEGRPSTALSSETWIDDLAAAYTRSMFIAAIPPPGGSRPGSRGYRRNRPDNHSRISESSRPSSVVVSSLGEFPSRPGSRGLVSVLYGEGNSRPGSRGLVGVWHVEGSCRPGSCGMMVGGRPESRGKFGESTRKSSAVVPDALSVEKPSEPSAFSPVEKPAEPSAFSPVEKPAEPSAFSSVEPNASVLCAEVVYAPTSNVHASKEPSASIRCTESPPATVPSALSLEEKAGGARSAEYSAPTAITSFSPNEPNAGASRTEDPPVSALSAFSPEKQNDGVLNTEDLPVAALFTSSLKEPSGGGSCAEGRSAATLSAFSLEEPTIGGPTAGDPFPAAPAAFSSADLGGNALYSEDPFSAASVTLPPDNAPGISDDQIPPPTLSLPDGAQHDKADAEKDFVVSGTIFRQDDAHHVQPQEQNSKEKGAVARRLPDALDQQTYSASNSLQQSKTTVQESRALTSTSPPPGSSSVHSPRNTGVNNTVSASPATPEDGSGKSMKDEEEEKADREVKQVLSRESVPNPFMTTCNTDDGSSAPFSDGNLPCVVAAPPESTFSIHALNAALGRTQKTTKLSITISDAFPPTPISKLPIVVPSPRKKPHRRRTHSKPSTPPLKSPSKRLAQKPATKPKKNPKQATTKISNKIQPMEGKAHGGKFTNESQKVDGEPATSRTSGKIQSPEGNAANETLANESRNGVSGVDPMAETPAADTSLPLKVPHANFCYARWMMTARSIDTADGQGLEHWDQRNFICTQYSAFSRYPRHRRRIPPCGENLTGLVYETWPFVDDKLLGSVVRDNVKPMKPTKERQTYTKPEFVNDVPDIATKLEKAPFFVPVAPRIPPIPKADGGTKQRVIDKAFRLLSVHAPKQQPIEKKQKPMDCYPILPLPIVTTWRLKLLTYGLYTGNKHSDN